MILAVMVCLVTACEKKSAATDATVNTVQTKIENDKIYFFYYNGCPYCHDALDYVNTKYPDLKLSMINIQNAAGYELFMKCATKFNLGRNVGTPLFCMGDNHLMGWGPDSAKDFDKYVRAFIK